ncbi:MULTISPECIES: ParB N-terminal domain-containing protein [Hyphomicrobiales]|jgi:ParB family chromosome partitioning protein|uniref:ParB N-terminal domain-containing protein n=1 Tax=Hyphomicrobiales TaxID=356 RepID=UPI0010F8DC30|nr:MULTISPECIES: ParB N-terminal domain-containing protein [Mesorhizobium]MBA3038704.1 plasmid partitioning protein [Rhizobiaceae bacterium]MBA4799825.1 ParB N-terminal domain-containing protein [Hyphomicrobiales bacterium]MBN9138390.1 ParB N-terminal domain-containing protein [Phyllobacterium sp.]MBN9217034.1 ParB N-terminal domain-containing protein [Mesorhizobium sp.]
MRVAVVDPRLLKDNPDKARQSKSSPQADALMVATIKAVGIINPPIVFAEPGGGNGLIIDNGHRRRDGAIAANLDEIKVLVIEAANDNGAMRNMVENIARENLNPVDQWRGVERLVALGWTEEAIALALALPVRQIKKLRLLANLFPSMLEQIALGDMPSEQQLRIIAAASVEDQESVWKASKPKKGDTAQWWSIANALNKKRMYARDASFGDDLAASYGIEWLEDLFAPANEDNRYTTNVEGFLGAQHEWMTSNLPKRGAIVEVNSYGQPELPKKAERVHGKALKSDRTAMYLDREGKVQSIVYRLPDEKKSTVKGGTATIGGTGGDEPIVASKPRPDVTQRGHDVIGDYRTDALHEALGRAPIEDDTLMALLVLGYAGTNVRVDSGAGGAMFGGTRFNRHAAMLFDDDGKFLFDLDTLRIAARKTLIDVLSCRRGMSNSGVLSRVAGGAIGADAFLPNMGTVDFLECLSRQALETSCSEASVSPRQRVRETRAALVEHFKEGHFVYPAARFAPELSELSEILKARGIAAEDDEQTEDDQAESDGEEASTTEATPEVIDDAAQADGDTQTEETVIEDDTAYSVAAE